MVKGPAEVAHGPLFIGFMFNTLLLGVLTVQVHHYQTTFKKDKAWMKTFVYILYLCNIVNTVLMADYLYNSLIVHFADVEYLQRANWVFASDPALTGIIATCVQIFFSWRVKVLTRSNLTALPVLALTVAGCVGALVSAVEISFFPRFTDFVDFKAWVLLWLLGQSAADVMITLVLVLHLWYERRRREFLWIQVTNIAAFQRRHKTGFPTSDEIVDKIIRLTVQTGFITTVCAIVDAIVFLVDTSGTHLIFNLALAKLYSITLMSSLNSRSGWAFDSSNQDTHTRSLSAGVSTSAGNRGTRKPTEVYVTTHPEVFVNVERHEMRDMNNSSSSGQGDPHGKYLHDDQESREEDFKKGGKGQIV
ncbi:hypothetical protein BT96DRAFT_994549 [Gymnopus androsaceus JB14]|uniref:DUF6534 domain-containing protein n=1 Tax=Gymnopus androsaceus JB14 TaxID=1447944 RepID=A0A6A4HN73_9AGAR|nr:hypothetical protein BT96DRAFT_994549 [Gymnopus androsaceus JB14]